MDSNYTEVQIGSKLLVWRMLGNPTNGNAEQIQQRDALGCVKVLFNRGTGNLPMRAPLSSIVRSRTY